MTKFRATTQGEPLWTVAGMTSAVAAILGLLTAFGLSITSEQQAAIMSVVAVLAPTVVAVLVRKKIVPAQDVVALRDKDGYEVSGPASPYVEGTSVEVWQVRADATE